MLDLAQHRCSAAAKNQVGVSMAVCPWIGVRVRVRVCACACVCVVCVCLAWS